MGPALNPHLPQLLVQISKKLFQGSSKVREKINEVLTALDENGGPDACKAIKAKVPTWQSLSM